MCKQAGRLRSPMWTNRAPSLDLDLLFPPQRHLTRPARRRQLSEYNPTSMRLWSMMCWTVAWTGWPMGRNIAVWIALWHKRLSPRDWGSPAADYLQCAFCTGVSVSFSPEAGSMSTISPLGATRYRQSMRDWPMPAVDLPTEGQGTHSLNPNSEEQEPATRSPKQTRKP